MHPDTIFTASLTFIWVVWLWDMYMAYRQYRVYVKTTERPSEVESLIDQESFAKSWLYKIDTSRFNFVQSIYSQLETTLILCCNVLPWVWQYCGQLNAAMGFESEIMHSVVFVAFSSVASAILSTPWSLYDTFVIEERHGFNKQTLGFYIKDKIKGIVVGVVIAGPIVAAIVYIVQIGGEYFFVYVWVFLSVATFFMMTIYPVFIAPLFDKYTPVADGELRTRIEELASSLNFPLTKLFIVEGSKRSAHSNAYLYGFWNNKRIVLYDTLVEGYVPEGQGEDKKKEEGDDATKETDEEEEKKTRKLGTNTDEIVAILAHELGHWKLNHVTYSLIISEVRRHYNFIKPLQLNLFALLWGFGYLYNSRSMYMAFGFHSTFPTIIGLVIVLQFIFAPYNEVLNILMTLFTRMNEFAADEFGAKLGYGDHLISGLVKLSKDNLSFPVNDWLYSWLHFSHPPLRERIQAIRKHM